MVKFLMMCCNCLPLNIKGNRLPSYIWCLHAGQWWTELCVIVFWTKSTPFFLAWSDKYYQWSGSTWVTMSPAYVCVCLVSEMYSKLMCIYDRRILKLISIREDVMCMVHQNNMVLCNTYVQPLIHQQTWTLGVLQP